MDNTFAFIGAGNMGGAVISAVCKAISPGKVFVYDRDAEKAAALAEKTGCQAAETAGEAVAAAQFVVLCVKPNLIEPVLRSLCPSLRAAREQGSAQVLASIAAGVTKAQLREILEAEGLFLPVIRLLPNTPVAVGKGLTLISPDERVMPEPMSLLRAALAPGGETVVIDEGYIDPATPVFSSSPAFIYMFIEALADGGVMAGLPRDKAQQFAAQALVGAATMVLETGKHPGQLKDEVCSPGGSTIVGVEALERGAFRHSVAMAVYEAYQKTLQLGK